VKGKIEGKFKFTADSCNATNDFGTIDATAVPCISSTLGSFDEYVVGGTVGSSNGDGFVEVSEVAFDAHSFVVTARGCMKAETKEVAHFFEHTKESTASINDNETTETNFQKEVVHEVSS